MNTVTLSNGVKIPQLGFGTWLSKDEEAYQSVLKALEVGYRHIDTAAYYGNEESIGRAIKDSGVPREELFVTTKLWNSVLTYEDAQAALEESLTKLGLDYIDLYLIHWPNPKAVRDFWQNRNAQVWRALEEAYQSGKARSIGVSNFLVHHMAALLETATVIPQVNQIRLAPGVYQEEIVEFCRHHQIAIEAWSPLGRGELFENETIKGLADKYQVSIAKVALAWSLQHQFIPLPKSVTASRIEENFDCFGLTLSEEEMTQLNQLVVPTSAPDPDHNDF